MTAGDVVSQLRDKLGVTASELVTVLRDALVAAAVERDREAFDSTRQADVSRAEAGKIQAEAHRDQRQAARDAAAEELKRCGAQVAADAGYVGQREMAAEKAARTGGTAERVRLRLETEAAEKELTASRNAEEIARTRLSLAQRDLDQAVAALDGARSVLEAARAQAAAELHIPVSDATLAIVALWYQERVPGLPELTEEELERAFGRVRTAFFTMQSDADLRRQYLRAAR
jgi:hypothetical protein